MSSKLATTTQQNDPTELLEVFDSSGRPTGVAKSRAAIHLDGDPHQAFHCWIVRRDGSEIVLQRRSLLKDTYAGFWDAAAAGHWRFGESAEAAAREIGEELGLAVAFSELAHVGQEVAVARFPNGLIDHEFHQVYRLRSDLPLLAYAPAPAEVIGLAAFGAADLVDLAEDRRTSIAAIEAVRVDAQGRLESDVVSIERSQMVPYSASRLRRLIDDGN